MKCSSCGKDMESCFMYVRGFGGALFWAKTKDTRFFSRRGLEQIDLTRLSVGRTGTQAVLNAARCPSCATIAFKGN